MNVMIDLETLGRRAGCVVVSIGAVKFTSEGPTDSFYSVLNREEQTARGMTIDADTLDWWMQQSADARKVFEQTPSPVVPELQRLAAFIGPDATVWANGASFDFPILAELYRRFDVPVPWKYWRERCFRTVREMSHGVPPPERMGVAHHALDDALYQTRDLLAIAEAVPAVLE